MVGDAILEIVVGTNLLRTVASAYLRFPLCRMFLCFLFFVQKLDFRDKNLHRLLTVRELAALRRGAHIDASRAVDEPHGGLDLVHVLSSCPAAPRKLHINVVRLDFKLRLQSYREHGDRSRRGVNTARLLSERHALDSVHTSLITERLIGTHAGDFERQVVDIASLPSAMLGIVLVHLFQFVRKDRRFITTRTGAQFHHDRYGLGRIFLFLFFRENMLYLSEYVDLARMNTSSVLLRHTGEFGVRKSHTLCFH